MQGTKIRHVGRIFALAAPSESRGHRNARGRKTKEERRVMIVSFVEKYKASNEGKFPPVTLTCKEVGGSYYTVREILQELKQEHVSCDTMGTDLEALETKNQTRHVIEPLSLPAESAKNGAIGNCNSLEHKETNYQETLSGTGEKKIVVHNDVLETCVNHQTQANEGRKIVGSPLGSNPTSLVVNSQPLQGLTKRQSISSASNGTINSNHHLELSKALSDTEEQGNITHNNVVEVCDPNDQTQAKQEIDIGERPPRISATSVKRDEDVLLQWGKGDVSTASIGVRDNNRSLALDEVEYLELLSDTEEQKTMIQNVVKTFGRNDHTQREKKTKIVEKPQGPTVSSVVYVQPLQEMMGGQSISSATDGFIDNNHVLEIDEAKHEETLSDTEEKKNIIHKDVETCGLNDQTQVKQDITIIEESLGTSAASIPIVHEKGVERIHLETLKSSSLSSDSHSTTCVTKQPQDLSFSVHHEDGNDLVLNSEKGIADKPSIPADKIISPLTNSVSAPEETTETPENILNGNHISAINEEKYQEALSDMEEKNGIIRADMETCGLNDQTQVKQDIAVIEESPGTSAASNPLITLEYHEDGEKRLHLETSKHLSAKYQEALSDMEEQKNIIHVDMETCSLNDQTQIKQDIAVIEESPGTSSASNPLVTLEYHEDGEDHLRLETSKLLSLSDSHSTTFVTNQPKNLSVSVQREDDNDLVLNSTKLIAEEPAFPADKLISPLTNSVTAPGEAIEIPDNILKEEKLSASNISSDEVLIGVKILAGDGSRKNSSESLSENLDGYSDSKYCLHLSDKKETASVLSGSSLDQGGNTHDAVQSTEKTNSDGYCASNSEKMISSCHEESSGDIIKISHDLSDGNSTPTLESTERTYKNTKSSKDRDKLETNMVSDIVNNILKGILYLLKK